ncbi:hypothetical protein B0H14DRAFT_2633152 [Mycena olivaceomarginata]|nr:hypothetical protein B0H14DRAFT_2633152 [Mycena olivaceomarginata]
MSQDTPADHAETRGIQRDTANQSFFLRKCSEPQPTRAPQIAGGVPAHWSEEIGRRILSDLPDRTEPIPVYRQPAPEEYPTHTLVQKVLAAPLRLPVCMCDCIGYTIDICNGACFTFISDDEITLRGIVCAPEPDPGCCTKCVGMSLPSGACPALNRQDYPAARRHPRAGMIRYATSARVNTLDFAAEIWAPKTQED